MIKGVILAGGLGTRLYPITKGVSKQLLPVYDKPMIYYPLSVLMQSGIKEILIISTPNDLPNFKRLLGNGNSLGINLIYEEQKSPDGLAQAFIIGNEFIGNDDVCMILGDNIFNGDGFTQLLKKASYNLKFERKATIFGYYMNDPKRYGVIEFDEEKNIINIHEKPEIPKSNYAVVGLYFYPNSVIKISENIKISDRGELEITSINNEYLRRKELKVELMNSGFTWLDAGTHESLIEASNYIKMIERRQGFKVACLEQIAYEMGYISSIQLKELALKQKGNSYGNYLLKFTKKIIEF